MTCSCEPGIVTDLRDRAKALQEIADSLADEFDSADSGAWVVIQRQAANLEHVAKRLTSVYSAIAAEHELAAHSEEVIADGLLSS